MPLNISFGYTYEHDLCIEPTASRTSFADTFVKFSHGDGIHMLVIAFLSTLCNVFVLQHHWLNAPHPKFILTWKRRLSIRLHVLSGTVEILGFVIGFWLYFDPSSSTPVFFLPQVIGSVLHIATAIYQTPTVFGCRLIMIPAYVGTMLVKIICTLDFALNPTCVLKSVRLYNIMSIYAWCRVFIVTFNKYDIFSGNRYTVAISWAGFACLPSVGISTNLCFMIFGLAYILTMHCFAHKHHVAMYKDENGRDIFDSNMYSGLFSQNESDEEYDGCPFASRMQPTQRNMLKALFLAVSDNSSKRAKLSAIDALAIQLNKHSWSKIVSQLQRKKDCNELKDGITFEEFVRIFVIKGIQLRHNREELKRIVSKESSYEEKARFLFHIIASGGTVHSDGFIDHSDLANLLIKYSLPISDVDKVMQKWDTSRDGKLSFDEFKVGFKPLIDYQIRELRDKLREMKEKDAHNTALKEYIHKKSSEFELKDKNDNQTMVEKLDSYAETAFETVEFGLTKLAKSRTTKVSPIKNGSHVK